MAARWPGRPLARAATALAVALAVSGSAVAAADVPQVLIVPLTGEAPAPFADAPARLSDSLVRAAIAAELLPVLAQADREDIALLTGCPPEEADCFASAAEILGVDRILVGSIEPAANDAALVVSLALYRPDGPPERRRIPLHGRDLDELEAALEPHAEALLAGRPALAPPAPAPAPAPVAAPLAERPAANFALGQVEPYSWALAGGGLALVGTGAVLLVMAGNRQDRVDDAPTDTAADLERLRELERSGKRLNRFGNGALVAGGVTAAAGVVLIIVQGRGSAEPRGAATSGGMVVSPMAVERGAGVTFTWVGR